MIHHATHGFQRSLAVAIAILLSSRTAMSTDQSLIPASVPIMEEQITNQACGHILTNVNVWSPDGEWIAYDTRSDRYGDKFDGRTIEVVNVKTKEVRRIYHSQHGAHCGVATFSPAARQVVFILGPENPTPEWGYSVWNRRGIVVDMGEGNRVMPLDARDLLPPFTPGALRGGSHVHVFSGDGKWVSFTYEDLLLATAKEPGGVHRDLNQRNVGVSVLGQPVSIGKDHLRNYDGSAFSVLVTRTVNSPRSGSDEISRAFEEAWVGTNGYLRRDGSHQHRALAFQGHVVTKAGETISEAFVVDIPDDVTVSGERPLEGTTTTRPAPPRGTQQRRLTFTAGRKFPGLQGPRHWLRSSRDGERIALLMRDDRGVVQIWTVSPNGGEPRQVTHNEFDVASAFTWSPDGRFIAYVADNSVFISEVANGKSFRLTARSDDATAPRPQACVFAPDGRRIAFVRPVETGGQVWNQIFVVTLPEDFGHSAQP
jgi:dipeptidyl aminopeptidase/acylaminoacyl peptidase